MSNEVIQSNYEMLEQVAKRFEQNQRRVEQVQTALARRAQTVARSWEGKGADAFQREMQSTLFPALKRLSQALAAGSQVSRRIGLSVSQAEQDAARLFSTERAPSIPLSEGQSTGSGAAFTTAGGTGGAAQFISAGGSGGGGGGGGTGEARFFAASMSSNGAQPIAMGGGGLEAGAGAAASATETADAQTTDTETDVDWSFISAREGGQYTEGYVPASSVSKSGVTVGTGFDIGQRTAADIDNMDIPDTLKEKLKPYAGLIKKDAEDYLAKNPLTITKEEADALDKSVKQKALNTLIERYDAATTGKKFAELPAEMQTVLASVEFQYGSMKSKTPNFWKQMTEQRWDDAVTNLRAFGDDYKTRRGLEADLLEQAINRAKEAKAGQ